jgi:hypothetical protein
LSEKEREGSAGRGEGARKLETKKSLFAARWSKRRSKDDGDETAAAEEKNKSHSSPYLSSFFSPKALRLTTAGVFRPCSRL